MIWPVLLLAMAAAPSADEIMQRVAENQDKAESARANFVYDQNVFVRLQRAGGKTAREETREYRVMPSAKGAKRDLLKLEGKIIEGKTVIPYDKPEFEHKGMDVDAGLTESFASKVMWEKNGATPMPGWFPLTKKHLDDYTFTLEGEERYRDYDVYKIRYQAKDHGDFDKCWRGEALIERNEFQPVLVTSHWDCKVPKAVTIMLGINVKQIGAKITYQRFDKETWFPVNCGGEMKLRLFFLYARTIAFSSTNSGFRKADVQTNVTFEDSETAAK